MVNPRFKSWSDCKDMFIQDNTPRGEGQDSSEMLNKGMVVVVTWGTQEPQEKLLKCREIVRGRWDLSSCLQVPKREEELAVMATAEV